ncbi:hypothetical protein ABTG52_09445, partial [Acinetobacter baumannii]
SIHFFSQKKLSTRPLFFKMARANAVLICFLFFSLAAYAMAVKNIPANDKKQPEWLGFGHYDGTVLVPGLGRYMVPKKGQHVNPFTYNPITGTNTGNGAIPIGGSTGAGTGRSYIPGGDDTTLPNPGVEVPNPAGGEIPAPSRH